ncbi:OmpP1/FadL family transporter [Acanthopleuribacter pedis]|uniref:Uncharacterized protein n=1 Tax=Acanthopleuribacter pedis TaxID=442870 RepID=A0A8J7U7L8_9BACT|nr:hypothetical protein [Acanthopleuribacter pedis]MBO1322663.1 hypothetical protein [Acanthopleuribacter pedis]
MARIRPWWLLLLLLPVPATLFAQTDETIFREFRFDFSTPGARANAMGRAFVGLSDEATAAYNNPAGLAVLSAPEFSFEFRQTDHEYPPLTQNNSFEPISTAPEADMSRLSGLTFASFSLSRGRMNLNAFYTNQLNYRRSRSETSTEWFNLDDGITFNYVNGFDVEKIRLDTYGLSLSNRIGRLSWGVSVGLSRLDLRYIYRTSLSSNDILIQDRVESNSRHDTAKLTFVVGLMVPVNDQLSLAFSAKRLPEFSYIERVLNFQSGQVTDEPDGRVPTPVTFKAPDSIQFGAAWRPNDFWTLVGEINWVQYQQLSDNMTVLSTPDVERELRQFEPGDFKNGNDPSFHLGAEYLWPRGRHIFAFRGGAFRESDHNTRFVGEPDPDANNPDELRIFYDIQRFIYNIGGNDKSLLGYTFGLGYVFNNKLQVDTAYVTSDDFDALVSSVLYRF